MIRRVVTAVVLVAAGGLLWRVSSHRSASHRSASQQSPSDAAAISDADAVDLASDDSFPASDPPSWTGTTAQTRGA